jgi:hypothetical protein
MRHPDASVPDSGALTPEELTELDGATVEDYQADQADDPAAATSG